MRLDSRLFALALLLPACAAHASAQTDYAYAFALDTATPGEAYRVQLTPAVYAVLNARASLGDIVVVNREGRPVPFGALPVDPPVTQDVTLQTRLLAVPPTNGAEIVRVERNASGNIVIDTSAPSARGKPTQWLIDAGHALGPASIELDAVSIPDDFQIHVDVDASNDLKTWQSRQQSESLTRVGGAEQLTLDVSGEPARYYRIHLVDGDVDWHAGQTPSVTVRGSYTQVADPLANLQWQSASVEPGQGGTDFDYQLPATLPVRAAKLTLPSSNVAAHATLLAGELVDGKQQWRPLGDIDIVRAGGDNGSATLRWTAPMPVAHLRVHVDTALAAAPTLTAGWQPDQFLFMAEGQAPYRLLAGSYAARRGDYPIASSLAKLRTGHDDQRWLPPLAAVGARSDAGGATALQAPKVPYDWTRPVLWAVLVLGALLIAGMAWSLLKSSRSSRSS
ncbi:MAG TPA: DUF3999 family protein [Dyella sp.]|uniref:DUF3999 family protein n=1 Tax=Dyella sp. TaxID=1869338 RepID=UPI002F957274